MLILSSSVQDSDGNFVKEVSLPVGMVVYDVVVKLENIIVSGNELELKMKNEKVTVINVLSSNKVG